MLDSCRKCLPRFLCWCWVSGSWWLFERGISKALNGTVLNSWCPLCGKCWKEAASKGWGCWSDGWIWIEVCWCCWCCWLGDTRLLKKVGNNWKCPDSLRAGCCGCWTENEYCSIEGLMVKLILSMSGFCVGWEWCEIWGEKLKSSLGRTVKLMDPISGFVVVVDESELGNWELKVFGLLKLRWFCELKSSSLGLWKLDIFWLWKFELKFFWVWTSSSFSWRRICSCWSRACLWSSKICCSSCRWRSKRNLFQSSFLWGADDTVGRKLGVGCGAWNGIAIIEYRFWNFNGSVVLISE